MISIDFRSKTAIVTGGGRGIGLGITEALAGAGANVIITYTSTDPTELAQTLGAKYGVKIHVYRCRAEDSTQVNEMVERISKEIGEVDFVIANAGVSLWRDTIDMTDEELEHIMKINLFAPVYLARAFTRHWLGLPATVQSDHQVGKLDTINLKKKILFVSSISGIVNMTPQRQMAYNASKGGLTMAARSLAGEWARYGITVNTISPGYVSTDMIANPPSGEASAWVQTWKSMTPVDRFAKASEEGQMVALMMSDHASTFMTGHDLVMDGGYTTY
ncbi:hypothetical protein BD324DRAFT_619289 [Kockovaella imperatae]|uniref:Uncharacterized protein n=1 Tax=Kockovaella imperatae TaxID=4999 RepID=A0A1Y1UPE2_9TREE|nr:hypothetical protein BD324DRAFT_619289 [Kockovaella imperatae]ORX39336.1 hypothetical protein BD324DRAFT_619289 [Kockovaella imperatae]